MSWPSPTLSHPDVSGANESERLTVASSGGIAAIRLERAACEIAIEEAVVLAGGFIGCHLEDALVVWRQRAGGIGIAGIAGKRESLAAAAAEIHFAEFARSA